jgi:hypothetical protein
MKKSAAFYIVALLVAFGCRESKVSESRAFEGPLIIDSLVDFSDERSLAEAFGKENVSRDTLSYPEGSGEYVVTVLYPNSPRQVSFIWNDSINFSGLNSIVLDDRGTLWTTAEGITVGTPLSKLVELNKGPLEFMGLEWDYGGLVSWRDGVLQHRGLRVTLGLPENYDSSANLDSLIGDQRISSEWAIARKINPIVIEVALMREHE